jgi:hypothetical protein
MSVPQHLMLELMKIKGNFGVVGKADDFKRFSANNKPHSHRPIFTYSLSKSRAKGVLFP